MKTPDFLSVLDTVQLYEYHKGEYNVHDVIRKYVDSETGKMRAFWNRIDDKEAKYDEFSHLCRDYMRALNAVWAAKLDLRFKPDNELMRQKRLNARVMEAQDRFRAVQDLAIPLLAKPVLQTACEKIVEKMEEECKDSNPYIKYGIRTVFPSAKQAFDETAVNKKNIGLRLKEQIQEGIDKAAKMGMDYYLFPPLFEELNSVQIAFVERVMNCNGYYILSRREGHGVSWSDVLDYIPHEANWETFEIIEK